MTKRNKDRSKAHTGVLGWGQPHRRPPPGSPKAPGGPAAGGREPGQARRSSSSSIPCPPARAAQPWTCPLLPPASSSAEQARDPPPPAAQRGRRGAWSRPWVHVPFPFCVLLPQPFSVSIAADGRSASARPAPGPAALPGGPAAAPASHKRVSRNSGPCACCPARANGAVAKVRPLLTTRPFPALGERPRPVPRGRSLVPRLRASRGLGFQHDSSSRKARRPLRPSLRLRPVTYADTLPPSAFHPQLQGQRCPRTASRPLPAFQTRGVRGDAGGSAGPAAALPGATLTSASASSTRAGRGVQPLRPPEQCPPFLRPLDHLLTREPIPVRKAHCVNSTCHYFF